MIILKKLLQGEGGGHLQKKVKEARGTLEREREIGK